MELYIFARFHAKAGQEDQLGAALTEVLGPTRQEAGCLNIGIYRSLRDQALFYLHSRWTDEDAFEVHAGLPHVLRFVERVTTLVDHPLEVARTELYG